MTNSPLAQLRDLQLGEPIGAWPLAYGWYLLMILVLMLLTALGISIHRLYQNRKPKKEALKTLALIESKYRTNKDPAVTAYQITVLLKRLCFACAPREKVAALHGEKWLNFLGNKPWAKTLTQLSYQKNITCDLTPLFPEIKRWINTCNKRLKYV